MCPMSYTEMFVKVGRGGGKKDEIKTLKLTKTKTTPTTIKIRIIYHFILSVNYRKYT